MGSATAVVRAATASKAGDPIRRQLFHDPNASPERAAYERRLLAVLLAQDGSATRLCETIAGTPVTVRLLRQVVTADVPEVVRATLPGERFIERLTCLAARGQAMTDNLSYIAAEGLAPDVRRDLEAGTVPIGHVLARLWVRRAALANGEVLHQRLWGEVGLPDPAATRSYAIVAPQGPLMVIAETYRRGMLMEGPAP